MHVKHPLIKPETLSLRKYQETIFSRAVDGNTLVVLPTGLGKTVVAAMLAAHRLYSFPDSKVLFLAPTRPLAVQHHKTFGNVLNLEAMVTLTGMDAVEDRKKLWQENKVIFATPQTIENDIMRGLDIGDVSLIIFDECHRCVGDYSYVFIAEEYMKKAHNPLILGLTASPSGDKETVKEICKNLSISIVEARTERDEDVAPYIQETDVSWVKVTLPDEFKKIKILIEDLLRQDLRALKERGFLESADLGKINKMKLLELQTSIRKDITSGTSDGTDAFAAISLAASALKINHALELLETQGMSSLDNYLERLRKQKSKAIRRLFADERMTLLSKNVHDLNVMGFDHPKLDEAIKIVKPYAGKKVMIFTQYRDSVDKIVERLNGSDILAREFIGQARKADKKGMSQKEQIKVLDDFREGKYDVLVATSVAEEGLDIPAVDLVLFYEPIPSEIRSIQRRGRTGRSGAGRVVILMARETRDESYYWAAFHKEKRMRKVVKDMRDKPEKNLPEKTENAPLKESGQLSLTSYVSETTEKGSEGKKMKIFIDSREKCTGILKILRDNAEIEIQTLPVGDYILSDRICAERKTVNDFLSSLLDKRLFSQAADLSRSFEKPIMLVEGKEDIYSIRGISTNAIRAAITALAIDFGISVIFSRDVEDTANYLCMIAKREQEEGRLISLHGEKKPLSLEERQIYVIESLPNVSAILARRLLARFGSVQNIMNTSRKELMEVTGIGEGKADEIMNTIRSRFDLNGVDQKT
ncbi:MAG: DEAD/DEAH box helicase [Candidatus Altiarchaeia archaeon]